MCKQHDHVFQHWHMQPKEDASTSAGGGGGAVRRSPTKVRIIETQYVHADPRDFKSVVQRLTGKESSSTATAVAAEIRLDVADRGTPSASTACMENKKRPPRLTGEESSTTAAAAAAAAEIGFDVAADRGTAAASTAGMESSTKRPAAAGVDGGVAQGSERSAKGLPEYSFIDELMEMLRD